MRRSAETVLLELLGDRASADWLRGALGEVREVAADQTATRTSDGGALARHFAAASRRLGRAVIGVEGGDAAGGEIRFATDGPPLVARAWPADEWGRAVLLRAALDASGASVPLEDASAVAQVERLFRAGDLREQQAVARCLAHLPAPERFVSLAVEIVRSSATALVEAMACHNPYPAAYLPETSFNQMVVKCLFVGLPLTAIQGLEGRRSLELRRMVADYASERRAAGRAVPADAALLL